MTSKRKFVLDFGSSKLVSMAACMDGQGRLSIESTSSAACHALHKGRVRDADELAKALSASLERLERDLHSEARSLVAGISGSHIQSTRSQGFYPIHPRDRAIRREDVLQAIHHSVQTPMPPDRERLQAIALEYRIDGKGGYRQPLGEPGSRLEAVTLLVTAQSQQVQARERALGFSGRRVEAMVAAGIASGLAVLDPEAMERGALAVDIGAGTTDLAYFEKGMPTYVASLPVSSWHITNDVSALLKTSFDEAERLKLHFGAALAELAEDGEVVEVHQLEARGYRPMQRRVLCEIIECRTREIVELIGRRLEAAGLETPEGGIVITGGGARLPGWPQLFQRHFETDRVRVGWPKVGGACAKLVEEPEYATAVGLACFALEEDEQEFSPISGFASWKDRIRTLKSKFGTKS